MTLHWVVSCAFIIVSLMHEGMDKVSFIPVFINLFNYFFLFFSIRCPLFSIIYILAHQFSQWSFFPLFFSIFVYCMSIILHLSSIFSLLCKQHPYHHIWRLIECICYRWEKKQVFSMVLLTRQNYTLMSVVLTRRLLNIKNNLRTITKINQIDIT